MKQPLNILKNELGGTPPANLTDTVMAKIAADAAAKRSRRKVEHVVIILYIGAILAVLTALALLPGSLAVPWPTVATRSIDQQPYYIAVVTAALLAVVSFAMHIRLTRRGIV